MNIRKSDIPETVLSVCRGLKSRGFEAYIVGGAVRDSLLNRKSLDWDVTTSATPEQVIAIFDHTIPTGIKHGTVTVILKNDKIEVTTMRKEGVYADGRRPLSVCFVTEIETDLARRDFTVNAIAYDPIDDRLVDPYGGCQDLKAKIIRTVGDPDKRFAEDRLRMLRAIRLGCALGFEIDDKTLEAIVRNSPLIASISAERIRDELIKLMSCEKPSRGVELLRTCGLLKHIVPELLEGYGVHQNRHHAYTVYEHNLRTADALPGNDPLLRIAGLLHDVGKPRVKQGERFIGHEREGAKIAKDVLTRLRFSRRDAERVVHLIKHHMFQYTSDWSDAAVRRFIRRVGVEHLDDLFELRRADRAGSDRPEDPGLEELVDRVRQVLAAGDCLALRDLAVNGEDIKKILKPGTPHVVIGKVLRGLLEAVIEEPSLNQRDLLLTKAQDLLDVYVD